MLVGVTQQTVAVLGLGRMGSAMARRLAGEGWQVLGWHRRGTPVEGIAVEPDLHKAVAKAGAVVLSLFDDAACTEVIDRIRPELAATTPVVNTSTTSPSAAATFADALGPRYVHAPVLGSVRAVMAGGLEVVVGGDQDTVEAVTPLLSALGHIVHVGHAGTAAALKLIANGTLAGALTTVREALRHADALDLDRALVLDVLQAGAIGGLVRAKRDRLDGTGAHRGADFTVAALAKDQALLAAMSPRPWPPAREIESALASAVLQPEDDIAALASMSASDVDVLTPLHAYIRGHATGDPSHFRDAFLPSAHIEGMRDGAFDSWTLDEYLRLFPGHPADDEASRSRRIDGVVVSGTVASATMTLRHGPDTFTDMFVLVDTGTGWRIANKVYHRHGVELGA